MADVEGWRLGVPAAYDLLWTVVVGGLLLLTATAVVLWVLDRRGRRSALLDLLLILVVPVLGPVAYLLGRLARRRRRGRVDAVHAEPVTSPR